MYKTTTNLYQAQAQISLDNLVKGTPKKHHVTQQKSTSY